MDIANRIYIMASIPRYAVIDDGATFHVTWQAHNKDKLLKHKWVKQLYYDLLLKFKKRYGVIFYSYCFMDNHIHLSGKLRIKKDFSDFFRIVNSKFALSYNREMKRRGQVIMDRFKSPQIQSDADLLRVMVYIDLNPKRANIVDHPKNNPFSSYMYYAYGKKDPLITPAPSYIDLGLTEKARQKAYQELVIMILKEDWQRKMPYSSCLFIGDPKWVLERTKMVQKIRRQKYIQWKKSYEERFG